MKNFATSFRIWSRISSLSIFAACILLFAGNITSVYAATAPTSASPSVYTHTQTTQQQLPATLCKQLKAQLPREASNPKLCTTIHTEISTGFIPLRQSGSAMIHSSCFSGTQSFRDTDWTVTYSVSLNTNWYWDGSCNIPSITYEDCHINWTIGVSVTQTACTSYTTNVPSRAALWVGWQQAGPFGARLWARRECYVNVNCNWATY